MHHDNNGQATNGARKHAWRTQAAWANILKGEISRLKLELEKKATLEEEFEKVEAVNKAIKKELNVTKARYEQQCTEMKHLRADIETS